MFILRIEIATLIIECFEIFKLIQVIIGNLRIYWYYIQNSKVFDRVFMLTFIFYDSNTLW